MQVELVVTAGPHAGRTFRFAEHAAFLVGRSAQAHFNLPEKDPHVSRLHFLVEVNPPLCRLTNMSAVNGTRVNGVKAESADLTDGDRITAGVTEFTFRLVTGLPPLVPPAFGSSPLDSPTVSALDLLLNTGTVTVQPGHEPPAIPGYRLEGELGRGGMGVVYRATHLATGDQVALKTILPRVVVPPVVLARFVRETDILRRLNHPGIVRFRDSGPAGGCVWLAMELVAGADAQAIADAGPLTPGRAVGWVVQALEALAHAHASGFVHRDVKPHNLLVESRPTGDVVKVADFGLARAFEASPLSGLTLTGTAGGTPPFMPPEQVRDMRSVQPPADQYAAAATLYRLLTGRHVYPPTKDAGELFGKILTSDPDPLTALRPDLPAGLPAAIHKALSREPSHRFPNCTAFATALKPFAG